MTQLKTTILLSAFILTLSSVSAAVIKDITVKTRGVEAKDRDFVLAYTGTKPGDKFNRAVIARDVKALKETGRFSFVDVQVERIDEESLNLIYVVNLKPRLERPVSISGANYMSPGKIRNFLKLEVGDPVDDALMAVRTEDVLKEYRKRYFTNTTITWDIQVDDKTGFAVVNVDIKEGTRAAIKKISFLGNKALSDKQLKETMHTRTWSIFSFITKQGIYDPDLIEADRQALQRIYQEHGYLDVEVKSPELFLSPKKLVIVFSILEGPLYKTGRIAIEGNTIFPDDELWKHVYLKTNDIASLKSINQTQAALEDYYQSRGYIRTSVQTSISSPGKDPVADVTFSINESSLIYMRYIEIKGNTRTRDDVIRRELLVYPGEVFNQPAVRRSENILRNLGFFSSVTSYTRRTQDPYKEDLVFDVEEKPTGQFMIGAGYSSVDSLIGYIELSQGNFDLFGWPSFTGGGQKIRTRAQFGTQRTDYEFSFVEPWFMDRKLSLGFDLYHRELSYLSSEYDERRTGGAVTLGKPLRGFFGRVNLRYGLERTTIHNVSEDASEWIKQEAGSEVTSSLRLTFIHDTRDSFFIPTRGRRITVGGHFSGGILGFDTQIYGFESTISQYYPLWFNHVLTLRGMAEVVEEYGDDEDVRIFDRLFLGGSRTLRGFKYRHAGPMDETGEPIGGKTRLAGTVEYTIPLFKPFRFAAFYDIGNVWEDAYYVDSTHFSDAGIGLRLDIPGFPVQLDYGWPLDIPEGVDRGSGRFNFTLGYGF